MGDKGDPGAPAQALRVVGPQGAAAQCRADEVMISAYCTGEWSGAYPLKPRQNGAVCGDDPQSTTLKVVIVCSKK